MQPIVSQLSPLFGVNQFLEQARSADLVARAGRCSFSRRFIGHMAPPPMSSAHGANRRIAGNDAGANTQRGGDGR